MGRVTYEFGGFRLDPYLRALSRLGSEPADIALPPRVFDTLVCLVERAGELLSKTALMDAVWPDVEVEENSLNRNISILRRTLGDESRVRRFIVTEQGRGYRFIADVRRVEAQPDGPLSTIDVTARAIAVLPFENLTGDGSRQYLGEAIAEQLIHTLAGLRRVKVCSRTSSFAYRNRSTDVREIARSLGVQTILEGSVRSTATHIRVTVQLIDGESGYYVWSRSLERRFDELFALQEELVSEVLRAIGGSGSWLSTSPPSSDLEAYDLFMQALSLSWRPSGENIPAAMDLLETALHRDPKFARAASLLAVQHTSCVIFGLASGGGLTAAEREASRALMLDPSDDSAHGAFGIVEALRGNWLGAETHFRAAEVLRNDPLIAAFHCLFVIHAVGHISRSMAKAERAFRAAPTQPLAPLMLGLACACQGSDDQARYYTDLCVKLGQPSTLTPLGDIYEMLSLRRRQYATAQAHAVASLSHDARAADGEATVRVVYEAVQDPGWKVRAVAELDRLDRRLVTGPLRPTMHKRLLAWRTLIGALDAAYAGVESNLDEYASAGMNGSPWVLLWMPELQPFRDDSRFSALAGRLRFIDYWREYGPPDGYELCQEVLVRR